MGMNLKNNEHDRVGTTLVIIVIGIFYVVGQLLAHWSKLFFVGLAVITAIFWISYAAYNFAVKKFSKVPTGKGVNDNVKQAFNGLAKSNAWLSVAVVILFFSVIGIVLMQITEAGVSLDQLKALGLGIGGAILLHLAYWVNDN